MHETDRRPERPTHAGPWSRGALALVLGLAATTAAAQTESDLALAAALSGDWTLIGSDLEAEAARDAGIAAAVAGLPPIVDGLAASELRARLPISRRVVLEVTPERITAQFAHASFDTPPGVAATVPVPGDASSSMEVTQVLRNGHLEQIFTTEGGRRWSTFVPSDDGTELTLDVVVRSDRLSTDVRYRLRYRRSR